MTARARISVPLARAGVALAALALAAASACRPAADSDIAPDVAARAARAALAQPAFVVLPVEAATVAPGESYDVAALSYDSAGTVLTSRTPSYASSNPRVATVDARGRLVGVAPGRAEIEVADGGARDAISVAVRAPAGGDGAAVDIDVFPDRTFQMIEGWEGHQQMGQVECRPTIFARYRDELIPRVVNELGMNRIRLELRSGVETHSLDDPGGNEPQSTEVPFRTPWYRPQNDNDDPFVADTTAFKFDRLDYDVTNSVLPIRRLLAERGESLYLTLTYVDFFESTPFEQMRNPEEYAELVTVAFTHLKEKFGLVPDAFEAMLEPDNTPWTPEQLGRAIVAAGDRLKSAGFTPDFIAPSTANLSEAVYFYDRMVRVPRVREYVKTLSYHRYSGQSSAALRELVLRAKRDGVRTAMLEHAAGTASELHTDLTAGGVSAWERFATAFCARRDNPNAEGVYYQINVADPRQPRVAFPTQSRFMRQYFAYVRRGAVRLGASTSDPALSPVAFRNAGGGTVVVVRADRAGRVRVAGLPAGRYASSWTTASRTGEGAAVAVTGGGTLDAEIPDAGFLTLYPR